MKKPYLYAETAFHHQGDFGYLKKLVKEAIRLGLDGIKFQVLINTNELLSSKHSNYETLSQYIFSVDQWNEIFDLTVENGLDIIFMPLDTEAFNLPISKISYFDIHPVSYYDWSIINKIKEYETPIILGVGGRTETEIKNQITLLGEQVKVLMVGFQSFPTNIKDVKLAKIKLLQQHYPHINIGYADHSGYNDSMSVTSNDYAFLLGATVFEKHLTLDEGKERVDFEAAIGAEKMTQIKNNLDSLYSLLKEKNLWELQESEKKYTARQRVAVASRGLLKGDKINQEDIAYKMIDKTGGFNPTEKIVGKTVNNNVSIDDIILKSCTN